MVKLNRNGKIETNTDRMGNAAQKVIIVIALIVYSLSILFAL
jgi:hypothetical protein